MVFVVNIGVHDFILRADALDILFSGCRITCSCQPKVRKVVLKGDEDVDVEEDG